MMKYLFDMSWFFRWMCPVYSILPLLAMAAVGAGGAYLGEKSKDKGKLERKEPPGRKFANFMQATEAARGISGRKSFADELEEQRLMSDYYTGLGNFNKNIMSTYGRMGTESPAMLDRMMAEKEGGMTNLLAAKNTNMMERRAKAMPLLGNLLAQNKPYVKQSVKKGPMWAKMVSGALQGGAMGMGGSSPASTPTPGPVPSSVGGGGIETIGGTGKVSIPGFEGVLPKKNPSLRGNKMGMMKLSSIYGG